jgi:enolase
LVSQLLTTALEEDGDILATKVSIDCHGSSLVHLSNASSERPTITYTYLNSASSAPPSSSIDTVEALIVLWKEYEMISLEDPFHPRDRTAYHHFKMVCLPTIDLLADCPSIESRRDHGSPTER